ncbi:uncharacterized protein MKZ38_000898 [Zalerion maritima]|uniref:Uncharacterized protein n=1 Tax=Zalerion maritima TaxID=339359 RepID=A0AAD5RZE1_9PEZI|nr:uncharacterized protein MKZ38_000898 [Zalerion maritima]
MSLPTVDWPSVPALPHERPLAAQTRHAILLTLEYLNEGNTRATIRATQIKADRWATHYFGTRYYDRHLAKDPPFFNVHPDIFNLNLPSQARLRAYVPVPRLVSPHKRESAESLRIKQRCVSPEPEYRNPDELEKFPEYTEATMVSGDKLDEIVDIRPRRRPEGSGPPPLTPQDLRPSALLTELPEFIARLAKSNLELETEAAEARTMGRRPANMLELDDEEAGDEEHIDLDIFPGVLEENKSSQPEIKVKNPSSRDESDAENSSVGVVSLNPAVKRKRAIIEVPHQNKPATDESEESEMDQRSPKHQRTDSSARPTSAASTSSSEPESSLGAEDSDGDREEITRRPVVERPKSNESNQSRDSNLSRHASSQGTRIRLVNPKTPKYDKTSSNTTLDIQSSSPFYLAPTRRTLRLPGTGSIPTRSNADSSKLRLIQEVKEGEEE